MNTPLLEVITNIDLFLKFFNNISDLVYLSKVKVDGSYEYMFANDPAKNFTGLTNEDFGRGMTEVLDEHTAQLVITKYDEAVRLGSSLTYEEEMAGPSSGKWGSAGKGVTYFETTVTPIFKESGECTHILAIARDITERRTKDKEIEFVKNQLELVWNSTTDVIYMIDENANFIHVNQAFTEVFGWTEEELKSDRSVSIIPNGYWEDIREILRKLRNGDSIPAYFTKRVAKGGDKVDVLASYSPLYDESGNWGGAVIIYKDVTLQKKIQDQLKESEEKYRLIAEHSSDLIKVLDLEGNVLYASPSHQHILDIDPDHYLNKSFKCFLHQEDMYKIDWLINKIIQSEESASIEIRAAKKSGEWVWIDSVGTPIFDEEGKIVSIITEGRDISERKLYEEKLRKLALYDHLTGLPNRTLFITELKKAMDEAIRTQTKLAVLFMDLDKFKKVNDTMGHDVGDQLLIRFAAKVTSCLREDDVLARFAGDEFVLLIPGLKEEEEVVSIAQRIIESLQEEWEIEKRVFTTTSSIGINFYPPYKQSYKDIIKYADEALYKAKENGRNHFHIYNFEGIADTRSICL
ncbi:diguanylate cyclase domain-containing protein [Rossellomorea oryzaecorticis]|uniref:Diguanylate cyclase domain-containing protein n=1 Tax=Rossellomorea oryzaecorticis TaxID=1396505 RepID=A0ABW8VLL1_9BACI